MNTRLLATLTIAVICATLWTPRPSNAQAVPVIDAAVLQELVRHDAVQTGQQNTTMLNTATTFGKIVNQTAQQLSQFKTMQSQYAADHLDMSSLFQGQQFNNLMNQYSQLTNLIKQNTSIISTDMGTDSKVLADFQKLVPTFNSQSGTYLNYLATVNRNANAQYASSLSMSQTQLQNEGGVQNALTSLTASSPQNELQALEQVVGVGKIQVGQMDSLIKIQSAMLKAMATKYAASGNTMAPNGTPLGSNQGAIERYCRKAVPFYDQLSDAAKDQAYASCQSQMQQAQTTAAAAPN